MSHLINILLISLFCVGWCRLLRPEMLLENLGYFIERYFGRFWGKPFGLCVPCSSSVIGSIAYLLLIVSGFTQYSIWMHIFYMVACVNLNPMIWFLTEFLIIFTNKIRKDLENKR
ncbi:MAG: hypothetical protein IPQ23_21675 [Cytophagaceae bacterium]|nr:hypothetical protein [Cytophagaceae bacterium]